LYNAFSINFMLLDGHFEERSWKRKQTRKRLTLYGAGSGSKNILLFPHPWFKDLFQDILLIFWVVVTNVFYIAVSLITFIILYLLIHYCCNFMYNPLQKLPNVFGVCITLSSSYRAQHTFCSLNAKFIMLFIIRRRSNPC